MPAVHFLHAAHQVRETLDGLALVSWLVIGLAVGALVLSWGRLLAWLRTPDAGEPLRLAGHGQDDAGWYFEVPGGNALQWWAESESGERVSLRRDSKGRWRNPSLSSQPRAIISSGGDRLPL